MNYYSFTRPGREWNEDRCYVCKDFGFVLDGATTLVPQHYTTFATDAEWLADTWSTYLQNTLSNTTISLQDIVRQGIIRIAKQYKTIAKDRPIEDFPSTTIAIFRIVDDRIEYFYLGDSPILLLSKGGIVAELLTDGTSRLDTINQMIIHQTSPNTNSMIEKYTLDHDCVTATRLCKNQSCPGGYYIVSDTTKAVDHASCGIIPKDVVDAIVLVSDGYAQIYDLFCILNIKEMFGLDTPQKAEKYYQKLFKAQTKDHDAIRYPRFKIRDDSSIVYYKVQ